MTDDATLLTRYARGRAERDFAEIVRRHVGFVYSSALRQLNGDTHLAQDVTQIVFTDLARKASVVAGHRVLAGWLFTSTRYTAAKLVRAARRRQAREQEALLMQEISHSYADAQPDWQRIRPVLDEALAELNERDREAILLRYFEGRDFAQVGAQLALSDNAARMRVDRAIDKLRSLLSRRGATSSTAPLTLALTGQATAAVPAGLAATVTSAALVSGSAVATLTTFMSLTKLQLGLASAVLATGAGIYAVQEINASALRNELASLPAVDSEIARVRQDNRHLEKTTQQFANLQVSEAELTRLRAEVATQTQQLAAMNRAASKPAVASAPRTLSGETLPITELDARPRPTVMKAPIYPTEMAASGVEGSVDVVFVIDATGKVTNARVVKSTQSDFEPAAIAAIEQWQFDPGRKGGRMVNTEVKQRMVFTMKNNQSATFTPREWF